jgi:hypothetical protein
MESDISDLLASVSLEEELLDLARTTPTVFNDTWNQTKQAILLKHWPLIMANQVEKAKRGDTASAKFITDFVQDLATTTSGSQQIDAVYEIKAIELRDYIGLEISAEALIDILLDRVKALGSKSRIITWLKLNSS